MMLYEDVCSYRAVYHRLFGQLLAEKTRGSRRRAYGHLQYGFLQFRKIPENGSKGGIKCTILFYWRNVLKLG